MLQNPEVLLNKNPSLFDEKIDIKIKGFDMRYEGVTSIRTDVPCADDIVLMSEREEALREKDNKVEKMFRGQGIEGNMKKTKGMVSGRNLGCIEKLGKWSCSVCGKGVGNNSLQCKNCQSCLHKQCSGIWLSLQSLENTFVCDTCQGLLPSQPYTLMSKAQCGQDLFECFSLYKSDEQGLIDLTLHNSYGGYYKGVESMGLFWALKAYSEKKISKRLLKRDVTTPLVVIILLYESWYETIQAVKQTFKQPLKTFSVSRIFMAPGVRRFSIKESNGLQGTLFLPAGSGPFPGLINMFGGMPGTLEYKPALFASHGFASLALPFHGIEGLPSNWFNLKMEYFEKAVNFLHARKDVDSENGVGVVGLSKGGQIALCMADCLTGIKCVIAINGPPVPCHNYHSYKGKIWKCYNREDLVDDLRTTAVGAVITRFAFPIDLSDPVFTSHSFNFHKKPNIAYMYIASLDDHNVPSELYCNFVEKRLRSENHPNYHILRYPGAGHLIESPYNPLCAEANFKHFGSPLSYGGKAVAHCRAQEDSWQKQLTFLRENLCRATSVKSNL